MLADELRVKTDVWSPSNIEGYQRSLTKGRARLYADFMENRKNISPPSILLSIREKPRVIEVEEPFCYIEIPDDTIFWIVDGQHRVGGIRELQRRGNPLDFSLPTAIMYHDFLEERDARYCEAKQFVVINYTQRRVRAELHERFLARLKPQQRDELKSLIPPEKAELMASAIAIADMLRSRAGSVWHERIKIPGQRGRHLVTQKTFTDSVIRHLLTDEVISRTYNESEIADIIDVWWEAWKGACSDAFEPRTRGEYILHRSFIGVMTINSLLNDVLRWIIPTRKEVTRENFFRVIEGMSEGNYADFWRKDSGKAAQFRGHVGVKQLRKILLPSLYESLRKVY